MREVCSFTDYFVVCSGRSTRQAKAIADEIRYKLKKSDDLLVARVEGEEEGEWILMDYLDAIVHIFTPRARDFYRIEVLWKEAPRLELKT